MSERFITSRDNPLFRQWRALSQDVARARAAGLAWIEGVHLCESAWRHGWSVRQVVMSQSAASHAATQPWWAAAQDRIVLPDPLFARLSALPSPAGVAFVIEIDIRTAPDPLSPAVVLDRLQDPGNVGSILRSAAAFGLGQVWALKGTVGLWSGKVLRAGMGAHFGLRLVEGLDVEDLEGSPLPRVATSSHASHDLDQVVLPTPCHWVFGHEGQGIDPRIERRCDVTVRVPQPGGQESLNVAAAAAVCLYESVRQSRA